MRKVGAFAHRAWLEAKGALAPLLEGRLVHAVFAEVAPGSGAIVGAYGTFNEDGLGGTGDDELTLINDSDAGVTIDSLVFDLPVANEVVFDPNQASGGQPGELNDVVGISGFDGNFDYSGGFTSGPRVVYRTLALNFSDFDSGEEVQILVDTDAIDGNEAYVGPDEFAGTGLTATFASGVETHQTTAIYEACSSLANVKVLVLQVPVPALGMLERLTVALAVLLVGARRNSHGQRPRPDANRSR